MVLVWIAYKLLTEEEEVNVAAGGSLWAAIKTIIIADAMMGLDTSLQSLVLLMVVSYLLSLDY